MEYFEVSRPDGEGSCSDKSCPCGNPGVIIPRGTGYVYISTEVVDFRRDARSIWEAQSKLASVQKGMQEAIDGYYMIQEVGLVVPILICKQGAIKRGLDLDVASTDAKYWWRTGLVPLRPTPMAADRSQQFEGFTVDEAKAAASKAIPLEMVQELKVTRKVQERLVIGEGMSREIAIKTAQEKVPKNAFDINPIKIVQKKQNGTLEIQAYSESEVNTTWRTHAPIGAYLEDLEIIIEPMKGFLGMGQKPGLWKVHWSTTVIANISFKLPAEVIVRYRKLDKESEQVIDIEEKSANEPKQISDLEERLASLSPLKSTFMKFIESDSYEMYLDDKECSQDEFYSKTFLIDNVQYTFSELMDNLRNDNEIIRWGTSDTTFSQIVEGLERLLEMKERVRILNNVLRKFPKET